MPTQESKVKKILFAEELEKLLRFNGIAIEDTGGISRYGNTVSFRVKNGEKYKLLLVKDDS